MPLTDDRGRVFGRVNLIDAVVAIILLGILPLVYGAFLLFRPKPPKIATVEPAEILEGQPVTLRVTGEQLRPFMTAQIGNQSKVGFLVENPNRGEIKVRDLKAGTYDLILLDRGQELVRKPNAIRVVALSLPVDDSANNGPRDLTGAIRVVAIGRFVGLSRATAALIRPGVMLQMAPATSNGVPLAEVSSVGAIEPAIRRIKSAPNRFMNVAAPGQFQVPVTLRIKCVIAATDCRIGDAVVVADSTLMLGIAGDGHDALPSAEFSIDDVRLRETSTLPIAGQKAWATIRARFSVPPEMVDQLHVGDVDVQGDGLFEQDDRATITAIGPERQPLTVMMTGGGLQVPQEMVAITVTLRVPVTFLAPGPTSSAGWLYKGRLVRVGVQFAFESLFGYVTGPITAVQMQSGAEARRASATP